MTGKLTVKNGTLKGAFTVTDLANFVAGTDVTLVDNVNIISGGKSYYRVLIDLDAYTDAQLLHAIRRRLFIQKSMIKLFAAGWKPTRLPIRSF